MPVRRLPDSASLDHLKYQAKDLLREHAVRDLAAAQRIREFHSRFTLASDDEIFAAKLRLSDAQLAIAREYGFPSWTRLKRRVEKPKPADKLDMLHHERIPDPTFRRAVDLLDAGDVAALKQHLKEHPSLPHQHVLFEGGNYFRNPALLEFVAENPIRRGSLPANIVEVASAIIDAGVDQSTLNETLVLVSTGSVARECRVQIPLIDLLCDRGADPDTAIEATVLHGELEAAHALIARGARITLPTAAALGRMDEFSQLLPRADARDRHLALALAAQFGQVAIVRLLLDAGENPDRYNPIGGHSHCTPLHQAALKGDPALVELLVERGARLDIRDILWHGTPADWARHEGKPEIELYLRSEERKGKANPSSSREAAK